MDIVVYITLFSLKTIIELTIFLCYSRACLHNVNALLMFADPNVSSNSIYVANKVLRYTSFAHALCIVLIIFKSRSNAWAQT